MWSSSSREVLHDWLDTHLKKQAKEVFLALKTTDVLQYCLNIDGHTCKVAAGRHRRFCRVKTRHRFSYWVREKTISVGTASPDNKLTLTIKNRTVLILLNLSR